MSKEWLLLEPEKRNYRRIDVRLKAEVTVEGENFLALAENISCGGIYLSLENLPKDTEKKILVKVRLPHNKKDIQVVGDVRRVEENTSPKDKNRLAVEFSHLYDDNILEIEKFIKSSYH